MEAGDQVVMVLTGAGVETATIQKIKKITKKHIIVDLEDKDKKFLISTYEEDTKETDPFGFSYRIIALEE